MVILPTGCESCLSLFLNKTQYLSFSLEAEVDLALSRSQEVLLFEEANCCEAADSWEPSARTWFWDF